MKDHIRGLRTNASLKAVAEATRKEAAKLWGIARDKRQEQGLRNCSENKRAYDDAANDAIRMEIIAQHLERLAG